MTNPNHIHSRDSEAAAVTAPAEVLVADHMATKRTIVKASLAASFSSSTTTQPHHDLLQENQLEPNPVCLGREQGFEGTAAYLGPDTVHFHSPSSGKS